MNGINGTRVLIGGLVAGIIITIGQVGFMPLVSAEWAAQFARLGIATPGETAMLTMVLSSFVLGVAAVWMYAIAIPRLGAKLETACIAGLTLWAATCLLPNLTLLSMGIFTASVLVPGSLLGLVLLPVATCVGTRLYPKEGGAPVRAIGTRAA